MEEDGPLKNFDTERKVVKRNDRKGPRPIDNLPPEVQRVLDDRRTAKETGGKATVEILEGKHVLSTLLYISRLSPVLKSDIYNDISRCSTMPEKLEGLQSAGLVEIHHTGRTDSNVIIITEKGRKVADLINEMLVSIDDND